MFTILKCAHKHNDGHRKIALSSSNELIDIVAEGGTEHFRTVHYCLGYCGVPKAVSYVTFYVDTACGLTTY